MLAACGAVPTKHNCSCPHTLWSKRFTLDAQLFVFAVNRCCGKNKFLFLKRGGLFLGWQKKNTLLKKLLEALGCAFFKSVFF